MSSAAAEGRSRIIVSVPGETSRVSVRKSFGPNRPVRVVHHVAARPVGQQIGRERGEQGGFARPCQTCNADAGGAAKL
jgi:hypothetical protein